MDKERIHRYKKDFSTPDYRKFYKKKYKSDIDNKLYTKIIEDFNKNIVDLIINEGVSYDLPFIHMNISIRKEKRKPKLKDGKLVNNNAINWQATKKLWEEDEESAKKKLLVRYNNSHSFGYIFKVYLKKFKCRLKCRSYYRIKVNRKFQRDIAKRINDPNKEAFDAFLLYKPIEKE